ncbi:hypothetical protein [Streptomyces sp. enrichment culture]|uniref:hypothetical protein n=1 Tax=Streptomyces sp. enrichment culture TaxID=1795815 RepID=UPI003F54C945
MIDTKAAFTLDDTFTAAEASALVDRLRATFRTGRTKPLAWRRQQLIRLRDLLAGAKDQPPAPLTGRDIAPKRISLRFTGLARRSILPRRGERLGRPASASSSAHSKTC